MTELTIRTGESSYYFNDTWQVEGKPNLLDNIIVNEIRAVVTGIHYEKDNTVISVWAVEETLYEQESMFRTFPDISIHDDWKGVFA